MRKLFSLFISVLGSGFIYAQTLNQQTISSSGGISGEDSGRVLLFNVGETVISTAINGSFILTQGFEQPDSLIPKKGASLVEYNIYGYHKVYPNPATQKIFVELMSQRHTPLSVSLIDNLGKEILGKEVILETGIIHISEFDISGLSYGQYYFVFRMSGSDFLHTVKWLHKSD